MRAFRWTLNEIRDVRRILSSLDVPDAVRTPTFAEFKEMEQEVQRRAREAGAPLPKQLSTKSLVQTYGFGYPAYATLSDFGSHPGFASSLTFFRVPGERRIDINLGGGVLSRAYFMSMAYDFGNTVGTIAAARGWEELAAAVRGHIDAHGDVLRRADELMAAAGSRQEPPPDKA